MLEFNTMPTVQLRDDKSFVKAIGVLLDLGGLFQTRHPRQLVIGPVQIKALRTAGLLPHVNGARKRGKKKA